MALAVAVLGLVAVALLTDPGSPARAVLTAGCALVVAALVLAAGRWPLPALLATAAVLVLYYALDLPAVGLAAPMAPVLYLAAERGRVLAATVVGAGLLAVSVGVRLLEGDDLTVLLTFGLVTDAALMTAVIALGDAVRSRRAAQAEFARRAAAADEERRRDAARQVDAERVRIARELHDTLGHTMSIVTMRSAVAQEALADRAYAEVGASLDAIRAASGGAMTELRATLGTLRAEAGREPAPGIDQLPALAERVRDGGLPVDLRVAGEVDALPVVAGTTAYRVVQEALTNALRHADATRAVVRVDVGAADLTLLITDDGRGGPPGHAGYGLRGMAERVELLGGEVAAGPGVDGGYRVHARLPLGGGAA